MYEMNDIRQMLSSARCLTLTFIVLVYFYTSQGTSSPWNSEERRD
jgi:hypothetical protein